MRRLVFGFAAALCLAAACSSGGSAATTSITNSVYAGSWVFVQGACTWGPITVSGTGAFGASNGSCTSIANNTIMGNISAGGVVTGTQAFQSGSTFTLTGNCNTDVTCSGTVSGGPVQSWTMSK